MQIPVSENLKKALNKAEETALTYSSNVIGTEHLLYGMLQTECKAGRLLSERGVSAETFERYFDSCEHYSGVRPKFSQRVEQTLFLALQISRETGFNVAHTEHVLFALLQDNSGVAYALLQDRCGVDMRSLMSDIVSAVNRSASAAASGSDSPVKPLPAQLKDLGVDVTQKARENKIDPIIGRQEEIERIIQILCRKTKNNPVLIGEPGVGKSAVVEGLAKAIVEGNVPELLKNKIVFGLDIGSLMAGTRYRGDLEQKLKDAISLIRDSGNIIVFIDEIHTLARAGDKDGEVSPADILKPYLARGEMQTIGATTTDEYRKFIEADKALERRFQPIMVEPPTVDQTIEILRGLRENYEAFHKVRITDGALVAAAKLSDRYITDRFLPDKAIDLVDEAMSRAKVNGNIVPPDIKEMESKLAELEVRKKEASSRDDFASAAKLRDEQTALRKRIDECKLDWKKHGEQTGESITEENIAEVVSKWTKIPVTRLSESETQRLMGLEEILHKRVIGQDEAVESVAKAIRRARAGLKDPNRPIGSFLFLGPTGVGKTELTKALGEAMFDDETAVIRLDMSEFMEPHSVSKLIGAPPGYVGFDDNGGQLTELVRHKQYSVVLFDEIEKAHPDVYNVLLQILDDGRLTDSKGRTVSFKNTIIIMTSNVGVAELSSSHRGLGFAVDSAADEKREKQRREEILMNALKSKFKPEFLNRIDVVSVFHALSKEDIGKIADIMLAKVAKTLSERGIALTVTPAMRDYIINKGYDPEYGARPLRRVIEHSVENNVAEALLSGKTSGGRVTVDISGDGTVTVR
ncbi:MAG: ATP-dependent Clp protease ATP-binding subunit [Clostridia bacterium]|nr:ATP-dependent Clp protease ATP-binding subunit [Clostridia bacterium]